MKKTLPSLALSLILSVMVGACLPGVPEAAPARAPTRRPTVAAPVYGRAPTGSLSLTSTPRLTPSVRPSALPTRSAPTRTPAGEPTVTAPPPGAPRASPTPVAELALYVNPDASWSVQYAPKLHRVEALADRLTAFVSLPRASLF